MEKSPHAKAQQALQKERRLAEMKKTISEWRSSGMSAQELGDSVGIPKSTLHFWSQELRRVERASAASGTEGAAVAPVMKVERPTFLPLVQAPPQSAEGGHGSLSLELFLQNGRRVALSGLKLDQVAPLLMALEGVRG
jgi:hypothetical protein